MAMKIHAPNTQISFFYVHKKSTLVFSCIHGYRNFKSFFHSSGSNLGLKHLYAQFAINSLAEKKLLSDTFEFILVKSHFHAPTVLFYAMLEET